jgi:hypothetical protein
MKFSSLACLATLATFAAGAASAATVTLTFSGTINDVLGPSPVALNERISGTFVLDDATTGAPGLFFGTDFAITSSSLTLQSGRTDTFGVSGRVNVRNDCTTNCVLTGNPAVDGFSISALSDGTFAATALSLRLSTTDTSVLPDEGLAGLIAFFDAGSLPGGNVLRLNVSAYGGVDIYGNDCTSDFCDFGAAIDTIGVLGDTDVNVVPLPAGLPLLLAGLGGLALVRRRR